MISALSFLLFLSCVLIFLIFIIFDFLQILYFSSFVFIFLYFEIFLFPCFSILFLYFLCFLCLFQIFSFYQFFRFFDICSLFIYLLLLFLFSGTRNLMFWPHLLHDFSLDFFGKINLLSRLGRYTFEAPLFFFFLHFLISILVFAMKNVFFLLFIQTHFVAGISITV